MIQSFEDLIAWQKAHRLVLMVYDNVKSFLPDEKFGVIAQIKRSVVSVAANIAEGHRKTTKDFVRFLDMAQGSL